MRKHIFDIPIDWLADDELPRRLIHMVASGKGHHITTVNPEFIMLSQENNEFKNILKEADLSLADGTGIILAQTYLDSPAPKNRLMRLAKFISLGVRYIFNPQSFEYQRVTGVALTDELLRLGAKHEWRVFLLGSAPGVAAKAAEVWSEYYPGLQVVGSSSANPDESHIVSEIKQANPDILLVAYGAPKQELFIAQHNKALNVPIMVGIGRTFDYAAGLIHRPPSWLRAIGLEWFITLIQQPRRIKRIYRSTIGFILRITR